MKPPSHYRVFNLRAQSDSWPWACGRNLYVALSKVQRPLLWLWEALAVVRWRALVRWSAADVVVVKGLVALVIWHRCCDCVAIKRQVFSRFPHYSGLLLLYGGALSLLEHRFHVVAVPVDHKQRKDHEGKRKEGTHHYQLIPVGLSVDLWWAGLSWKDDKLLLGDLWCTWTAYQGGALLLGLALNTVVCQQLSEAFLHRPALVGFLPVSLSYHY